MTTVKAGHVVYTTGEDTIIAAKGSYVIGYGGIPNIVGYSGSSDTVLTGSEMTFIGSGDYNSVVLTAGSKNNHILFNGIVGTVNANHNKEEVYFAKNMAVGAAGLLAPGSNVHIDLGNAVLNFSQDIGVQYDIHGATQATINAAYSAMHTVISNKVMRYEMAIGNTLLKFSITDPKPDIYQFHAA